MLFSTTAILAFAATAFALPAAEPDNVELAGRNAAEHMNYARAERHKVTFVNNCGAGTTPRFLYRDGATPRGGGTINGPLYGGVAWLQGKAGTNCLSSGVNCGIVEFTLINIGTDPANTDNSIDYSLQTQGNHQFKYKMNFRYDGGGSACSGLAAPGACTSATNCPGAFVGSNTASGTPVQCQGNNAGIVITFC